MDFRDIDLANMHVNDALKMGLELQRVYRALHANENISPKRSIESLRTLLLVVKRYI